MEKIKKKKTRERKWIFRYIRADLVEIDMGFFKSKKEAEKARNKMASFGAICSEPIRVKDNYGLYKRD
ncbi:MAG: hypothetical protein ACP5IX_02230 [Patescibacteria group bacterium]